MTIRTSYVIIFLDTSTWRSYYYSFYNLKEPKLRRDDMVQGSLSSNLNLNSPKTSLTDYQTFERRNNEDPSRLAHPNDSDTHSHHPRQETRKRALRDFFTVLAISFHAVLEGLAVGLEPDSANTWILFAGKEIFSISNKYFSVVL